MTGCLILIYIHDRAAEDFNDLVSITIPHCYLFMSSPSSSHYNSSTTLIYYIITSSQSDRWAHIKGPTKPGELLVYTCVYIKQIGPPPTSAIPPLSSASSGQGFVTHNGPLSSRPLLPLLGLNGIMNI